MSIAVFRPKTKRSDQELFDIAYVSQTDHRPRVGIEECPYCGELWCDLDCDGAQGDWDNVWTPDQE